MVSIIGVIWGVIMSSIYWIINSHSNVCVILLLLGWLAIYIFGRVFQIKYFPNLLYTVPEKNINILFKFQLTSRISADEIFQSNSRKYKIVNSNRRENDALFSSSLREINPIFSSSQRENDPMFSNN
ncbi:unnamed protein product [Blepharisma stoltei]|uniref:Photosystem I assembly protein Ycf4 n=1 Tax=Blepharisma stoltei TaxID=1481888 RepID=A0AAU9K413_9CILI|nr:unnamed protein product [Blepharisma stoltei]